MKKCASATGLSKADIEWCSLLDNRISKDENDAQQMSIVERVDAEALKDLLRTVAPSPVHV